VSDLTYAVEQIGEALPAYVVSHKMFEGDAKEVFASEAIKARIGQSASFYRVNVARKPVTALHDRLEVSSVTVVGGEEPDKAATQLLQDQLWEPNELDLEIPDWVLKTLEYGDAYLHVWPADGAQVTEGTNVADKVDVFIHSPEGMRAFYDPENPRRVVYVAHVWQRTDQKVRVNLYYRDRIERWLSRFAEPKSGAKKWVDNDFEVYVEEGDKEAGHLNAEGHLINPYDTIPIFHGRAGAKPYGRPAHKDAFGPQNIITKLVATQLSVVEDYGFPFRAALSRAGTTGADLVDWNQADGNAPSRFAPTTLDGRRVANIGDPNGPGQAVPAPPGSIAKFHDTDSIVQLEGAPASNFIEPITLYMRILSVLTDTPMDGLNPTGAPESGESRKAKMDGLFSRAEAVQLALEGTLSNALEFGMRLLGHEDASVKVTWKPLEKISDKEGWLAVQEKINAGVPVTVALTEAGYLTEEVEAWDDTVDSKVVALNRIADVAIKLGQASTLGMISPEQAATFLTQFITETTVDDSPAAE
jgi:hypothetical protein